MKERILSYAKYIFFALFIGIVWFGVKDTFCDIHAIQFINTNNKNLNEYIFIWDDATFEEMISSEEYNVTYTMSGNRLAYGGNYSTKTLKAGEKMTAKEVFEVVKEDCVNRRDANSNEYEKYNKLFNSFDDAKVLMYTAEGTTHTGYGGSSYTYKINTVTLKLVSQSTETHNEEIKSTLGYQQLAKKFNISQDWDEYINAMMKDFRQFSIALAKNKKIEAEGLDGKKEQERIQELCLKIGFDKELCYGLIEYVLENGGGNGDDVSHLIEQFKNKDNEGYEDISNYINGKNLVEYTSEHKPFYYFVYDFYKMETDNTYYDIDNLEGFYVGLMGDYHNEGIKYATSGLGIGLGDAFLSVLSATTDDLAESVIWTIAHDFSWGLLELLEKTGEKIDDFTPSIKQYLKYFGGLDGTDKEADVAELFNLNNLFYYIGAFLLVLLALIQLVQIIIDPKNAKTTWEQLLARFIVLVFFISQGRHVIKYIFDLTNYVWEFCTRTGFNDSNMDRRIIYKAVHLVTYDYFGINWTYNVMGVIFNCAIGFTILKNIFMLLAECVERYIVAVLLYFSFPTAISFGVSPSTENTTKQYFMMLGSQLFMLFMNLYFIKGFVILLDNQEVWANSLYGILFVLAYLKVAQAFDSYLSSMGLSVAHTSGRVASELFHAGSALMGGMMLLGRVGMGVARGLGRGAVRGTGNVMSNMAISSTKSPEKMARLFNLGENLRTRGLAGLTSGAKRDASTVANLNSARTGKFGIGRQDTLRNALLGGAPASQLNANPATSGASLLNAMGKGISRDGLVSNASFSPMGQGLTYSGTTVTNGGRTLATNGRLALYDSQFSSSRGTGATAQSRPMGVMDNGDILRATISANTGARTGDSFTLNRDMLNKRGNEYDWTGAEMGLGANFAYNDTVRANTLDKIANGSELTFTKTYNGNIAVSDKDGVLGYTSANGDTWLPNRYETDYTLSDLNNGFLSNARPTASSEAVAVIRKEDYVNGDFQATPEYIDYAIRYAGENGYENYALDVKELQKNAVESREAFEASANHYLEQLQTEGSAEREAFIEGMKANAVYDEDEIESFIPTSIYKEEGTQYGLMDIDKSFVAKSVLMEDAEYRNLQDQMETANADLKAFNEEMTLVMNTFSHEGDVVFYMDKEDNNRLYANEIHKVTEGESDNANGASYTVIPLDIDKGIDGTEQGIRERLYRKYSNSPDEI